MVLEIDALARSSLTARLIRTQLSESHTSAAAIPPDVGSIKPAGLTA